MKLVFAAPESGLPSALTALVAQLSAMHFFMKDVFAAPASALPSLPTALVSQVSCAKAAPPANMAITPASTMVLIIVVSLECWPAVFEFDSKILARSRAARGLVTRNPSLLGARAPHRASRFVKPVRFNGLALRP